MLNLSSIPSLCRLISLFCLEFRGSNQESNYKVMKHSKWAQQTQKQKISRLADTHEKNMKRKMKNRDDKIFYGDIIWFYSLQALSVCQHPIFGTIYMIKKRIREKEEIFVPFPYFYVYLQIVIEQRGACGLSLISCLPLALPPL